MHVVPTWCHAGGARRGKTCSWCQARENLQLVPGAGKLATSAKRRKHATSAWREKNLQLTLSRGGETRHSCQEQENMQLALESGKTRVRRVGFGFASDRLGVKCILAPPYKSKIT